MTYDVAVWQQSGRLSDDEATAEFERRADQSDERWPDHMAPPTPELRALAGALTASFPQDPPPWEDLWGSIDGDFLYLTMSYDQGPEVEEFLVGAAPRLGLLVYSPIAESVVAAPQK